MVANGSEPREILLDPMIAGSRGADGCEFDREVDRECSPRVDSLDRMGLVEEPARNSAAIAGATGAAATFRFGEQNPKPVPQDGSDDDGSSEGGNDGGNGGRDGRSSR